MLTLLNNWLREASMKRRLFFGLVAGAAATCVSSTLAQKRPLQVGWLAFGHDAQGHIDRTLKEALAQSGFVEGRNIEITYRFAKGSSTQLSPLAGELAALKPDILIGIGGDVVKALFDSSKRNLPIVGGVSDNPIKAGLANSLARPDKNFTGVTFLTDEMAAKRMELLKEAIPDARHVAVIYNPQHLDDELIFARRAAESLALELSVYPVTDIRELDAALVEISCKSNRCHFCDRLAPDQFAFRQNCGVRSERKNPCHCSLARVHCRWRFVILWTRPRFAGQEDCGICSESFKRHETGGFAD